MLPQPAHIALSAPLPVESLPSELQGAVQALSDTYETLDLRIETTFANAENDFIAALSEVEGCEAELREFVSLLLKDLRRTVADVGAQQIVLQLSFESENDLAQQVLSSLEAQGEEP